MRFMQVCPAPHAHSISLPWMSVTCSPQSFSVCLHMQGMRDQTG